MGAYTTATLYRPSPPPHITTGSLADFIERLCALDLLGEQYNIFVMLKFGKAIDQDQKGTMDDDPLMPGMSVIDEYPWDVETQAHSLREVIEFLRAPIKAKGIFSRSKTDQTIYRAHISLGGVRQELGAAFSREASSESSYDWIFMTDLSISIEPVVVQNVRDGNDCFFMGWMAVNLHGQGSLYPWTYEDTMEKIRANEYLDKLKNLCQSYWPVPTVPATNAQIQARKASGLLWGGEDYDASPDWRWVINESF